LRFEHTRPEGRLTEVRCDAVPTGGFVGIESAPPGMNWSGGSFTFNANGLRMPQPIRRATLVAFAATLSAHAQGGDIAAGHSFAREACSTCHVVDAQQQRPPWRIFIGPAFRNIANTRGTTATALRVFLTTSHPKMPNPIATPEQMADVIAYILSLRSDRDPKS
jgi:mono/diheme cytochrome c family protein